MKQSQPIEVGGGKSREGEFRKDTDQSHQMTRGGQGRGAFTSVPWKAWVSQDQLEGNEGTRPRWRGLEEKGRTWS